MRLVANGKEQHKIALDQTEFTACIICMFSCLQTILHFTFNSLNLFEVGSEYPLFLAGIGRITYLIYLLKCFLIAVLIHEKLLFCEKKFGIYCLLQNISLIEVSWV